MPQFTVQDPDTGRTVTLEGDSAPTERELVKVFNQLKTPKEKALDAAGDVAAEFGPMVAGQMIGAETGPGYFAIAPAAGAYGTYARQKRQIERGERDDYNYWEMLTSGLVNAVPASAYLRGGASMGQYLGRTAAIGAATAAAPEAVRVAEKAAEDKRIPSYDEYLSIAKEGAKGAAIGAAGGLAFERASALSAPARRLWGRITGRTQEEANQILQQVAENGTRAEQNAAEEMIDVIGQQMGIVRPSTAIRSAEESAAVMGVQPVKSARESASLLAEAPLTAEEVASREVRSLAPKSAEESAAAMGVLPTKSARESAQVISDMQSPAQQSASVFERAFAEGQSPQAAQALSERFSQQAGRSNLGLMTAVGALGAAGIAATELQAKPNTIIVKTPAGDLKYDPSQMSLDDIQKDAAKRVEEWKKIQAAAPHLDNRANYENAPDDQSKLDALLSWSNARKLASEASKSAIQAAGSRLPIALRPGAGMIGEIVRGQIAGETPTYGQMAEAGISSLPRGGAGFGQNALQFAGANVAGAVARGAIDKEDLDFKKIAEAAAKGGLQAAAVQTIMRSPLAGAETRRQQANRGEIEVFNEANRLGIVIDPAATTNPTRGQEIAVKLAGGSTKFSQDASRVNVPRVTEVFQSVAGRTGNPDIDANLSPVFFRARLAQEGRVYDTVANLPGMRQVVEDWKRANFNSARQYRLNAESGSPESLAAARQFREEADGLFQQIQQAATQYGGRALATDLLNARSRIAQLHAIEIAVNPADYKPDRIQALGQMYRDNPRYFSGDLSSVARIAAAQPQVFQDVRMTGTRGFSKADLTAVPYLRSFLQTGPGQRSIGNTGLNPTFLAQLARYGTGAAAQNVMQPTP